MRSYVILVNWTDQGVKNSRETLMRARAFGGLRAFVPFVSRTLNHRRGGRIIGAPVSCVW